MVFCMLSKSMGSLLSPKRAEIEVAEHAAGEGHDTVARKKPTKYLSQHDQAEHYKFVASVGH